MSFTPKPGGFFWVIPRWLNPVISSSLTQDALATKVWSKPINAHHRHHRHTQTQEDIKAFNIRWWRHKKKVGQGWTVSLNGRILTVTALTVWATWRNINTKNGHSRVDNVADDCCKLATWRTLETEPKQRIHNHIIVSWDLIDWRHRVNERQTHLDALCCQSMVQRLVCSLRVENTRIVALITATKNSCKKHYELV